MKLVLKQFLLSTAILLTGVACTSETHEGLDGNPSSPSDGNDPTRREVVVTIKNQLSLAKSTKAGEIATAEENKISSLDIYAFGSATEDGTYTLQERFAYRENPADVPATVTAITVTQSGDNNQEAAINLKLKKGLFVKLYAVANQPQLVDPSGTIGTGAAVGSGKIMQDGNFTPLILANPGVAGTTVQTPGVPTETQFLAFHSTLLDAATTADVLASPLPMSGAYTIPLDLTDFESFSHMQAAFKLTRTVARFDVINNAADSRFTITGISMGNARRGTTFFPIKPNGPADLITLPTRTFTGMANANAGTTVSAFYSYPSPQVDNGYIILSGTYRMNETDPEKTVTYQVPFKQETNGTGSHIEVNPNHRYTITITKADDYHIDFDLTVADWADAGNDLDGFEPTPPVSPITFIVTGAAETVDDKIRVDVDGGTFTLAVSHTSKSVTIETTPTYEATYGGDGWLTITPVTKAAGNAEVTVTVDANNSVDAEQRPHEVHIGYITVKWGETPEEQMILAVYRGASLVTYLDTDAGQTIRFAAVKMKDGKYWAPINVGATTAKNKAATTGDITADCGKLFQWGRLYGFVATADANTTKADTTGIGALGRPVQGDLGNMSKWDGKFIYSSFALEFNWLQINGDGNANPTDKDMVKGAWYQQLWNANEGVDNSDVVKTSADPCPKGWRVPTQAEWIAIGAGLEPAASGTTWDGTNLRLTVPGKESGKNLILPAAGGRNDHMGTSTLQGEYGCCWSSSMPSAYTAASTVTFSSASKLETTTTSRAHGLSVRCVQE